MERTWRPTTAGILTIIAGCWGILGCYGIDMGSQLAIGGIGLGAWGGILRGLEPIVAAFGYAGIAFGIVALIGGIYAMRRKVWGLALAGAILAIPLLPLGTVLGILSVIFVSRGKKEFA